MKSLTVNQVYKIANKIFDSKELDKRYPNIFSNKERLQCALDVLSLPKMGHTTFKELCSGNELGLYVIDGRIHCYIVDTWDYCIIEPFPISKEVLMRFEVNEKAFKMLEKFGV